MNIYLNLLINEIYLIELLNEILKNTFKIYY